MGKVGCKSLWKGASEYFYPTGEDAKQSTWLSFSFDHGFGEEPDRRFFTLLQTARN
jgi:hypothetical protein